MTASGRSKKIDQPGGDPGLLGAGAHAFGIISGADENRIVVKPPCAGRIVVRVIQSHQSVPQEGSEAAASLRSVFRGPGLDDPLQVCSRLQGGVADVSKLAARLNLLQISVEDGPRQLHPPYSPRPRHQTVPHYISPAL